MHRVAKTILGATLCATALWLTACTTPPKSAQQAASPPACKAVGGDDALVGNWLSVDSRKGVAGSLRTLYTLNLDGTMTYVEQLKRPGKPSQGLHESGCWHRDGKLLVLQTRASHGVPVDVADPIYTNRYRIDRVSATDLRMQAPQGVAVRARRMSPGYRLPF
ncbi:MAG: hypothetical protein L0H54_04830 [Alcaligenaceae bacterium]|nr:hypothetical protein [Alcaligenaceae bacterium]